MGYILRDLLEAARDTALPVSDKRTVWWNETTETTAISLSPRADAVTRDVAALVDRFLDVGGMEDDRAAAAIKGLALDVLIDVDGHVSGVKLCDAGCRWRGGVRRVWGRIGRGRHVCRG